MPIQWGPSVKKLAEVGIEGCEFCHEPAAVQRLRTVLPNPLHVPGPVGEPEQHEVPRV